MNQYSVILRSTNDKGQRYDLEVTNIPQFLLDISAIEVGEIGTVFGISSQEFALPGTDNNNQFFNNVFNLGTTPAVALNKSVPCQVLVDGESVFAGKMYINNIISDEYNDVIYNCVVVNETVDFRILNENKGLGDLNWTPYSHSYSYASVSQSWNDQLFSGSIFYPLINYGANPLNVNSPGFEFGGAKYQIDNPTTPLLVTQFKPAIQVKTIVDQIFNSINYKYSSSFFESTFFKNLYYLTSPDDKEGFSYVSSASGSYAYAATTQSVASGFTTIIPTKLNFGTEVYDTGNNYNPTTSVYTAKYTGNHLFNFNIPFNITSNFGPLNQRNAGRQFVLYITLGSTSSTIAINKTSLANQTSGVINTGNISVNLTAGQQVSFFFVLQTPSSNGLEQFRTVTTAGQNGVYFKVQTPQNPYGGTVNVGRIFGDTKVLDFMKGLIEKFNLVMEPVEGQKNLIIVEPYSTWLDNGQIVNWTNIVDRNSKYKVEHPVTRLPKNYKFSDSEDDDVLNTYQKNTYGNVYGAFTYETDSDLASGDKEIGGFFAATPVKGIPVKGTNGTTVLPWMVKQEPGKYAQGFRFKDRLLYKQPLTYVNQKELFGLNTGSFGSQSTTQSYYYIEDQSVPNGVRALTYYRTALSTTESPTIFSSSVDLHYSNIGYAPYQQSAVNGQCTNGLYNTYWANYINSLYDIDARILTCNIVLNPADIKSIRLNDKIFIDDHYYRINKISGANLIQRQSVEVELIKVPARVQQYTGRRRVPTKGGIDPTDFKDVIIYSFTENGNALYQDYETGEDIVDQQILAYAAALDNLAEFEGEVVWNNQQPTNVNNNIFVLGNTKYNETQQNVIAIGAGNTVPDNFYNGFVFGDNNIFSSSAETSSLTPIDSPPNEMSMIVANDATIIDSQRIVLIQPSGSRIISGSTSNVFINPINDINASDPTGSVYTGNLINQGTADFKDGAAMTGSVNITGSLTVNGISITGSATSTYVPFSFGFGTDPTTVSFVTIPNVVGGNRAFTLTYQLTSGSDSINGGTLQIVGDGSTLGKVDKIAETTLTGAPTASFNAIYSGANLDIKATFIGTSYIISGSYSPFFK